MDLFEGISREVTLFLVDNRIINYDNGGTFDYIFGRVFFFLITATSYMFICSRFVSFTDAFITIFIFNFAYNVANRKTKFHSLKMQNCALISGILILISMFISIQLNLLIEFRFSFVVYNLISSYIISLSVVSNKGQKIFRWVEKNLLFTRI